MKTLKLQIACKSAEHIGQQGLDKQVIELDGVDLQELLREVVSQVYTWQVLDLLDRDDVEDYVDPDGVLIHALEEVSP